MKEIKCRAKRTNHLDIKRSSLTALARSLEGGGVSCGNRHVARDPDTNNNNNNSNENWAPSQSPGAAAIKQQMNSGSNMKWTCMELAYSSATYDLPKCTCVCGCVCVCLT